MSATTSKSTDRVLAAAAAPPLLLAAFGLLLGLGVPPLGSWFWPAPTTNLAEAALVGDAARVRALVAEGAALDRPLAVRSDLRNSAEPATMTPLEAATGRGHDELVQLLLELGAARAADPSTAAAP